MKEQIRKNTEVALRGLGDVIDSADSIDFSVEHPTELSHGEYSTNVAMALAKKINSNPRDVAQKIVDELKKDLPEEIDRIEIAGPGFINFYLSKVFFKKNIQQILNSETNYGRNENLKGKRVIVEYTDPNPFKQFHIGHLMSNSIGEALSRMLEWNGAEVVRVCYQGDVGMHVAKSIWGMKQLASKMPNDSASLQDKTAFLGEAYTNGANKYEDDENAKTEIHDINRQVYELYDETKSNDDPQIAEFYKKGREWSLQHFDEIYGKLGTNFSQLIFENQMAVRGVEIVTKNTSNVFEESEGAIVYRGEKDDLHTRVFINSQNLPTYEAKDLALAYYKEDELTQKYGEFNKSIIVTASEQLQYMKVVIAALKKIRPEIAEKSFHITHGMMRFAEGKMSSRLGNVVTGESLIDNIAEMVAEKIAEADRGFDAEETAKIKEIVSVGAIKYSILKQTPGKDIVFDPETSVSFEGDSGPYLQYTYTRAKSVIDKAREQGIVFSDTAEPDEWQRTDLEKFLYRFPETIEQSYRELAPQIIVTLLTKIAGEFNSFYAQEQILGSKDEEYKLAITKSTMIVLQNGLKVLGIRVPERM